LLMLVSIADNNLLMGLIVGGIIAVAVVVFIILPRRRAAKARKAEIAAMPEYRGKAMFESNNPQYVGKSGLQIFVEPGVSITAEAVRAMEDGLENTFAKAKCDYGKVNIPGLRHSDYRIAVLKSELTPGGNYAFRVPVDGYIGTKWDMGGYIFAGAMILVIPGYIYTIAIPDNHDRYAVWANAADYEGEHWVLATLDGEKYDRTKVHTEATPHPIMGPCDESLLTSESVDSITVTYGDISMCVLPVE